MYFRPPLSPLIMSFIQNMIIQREILGVYIKYAYIHLKIDLFYFPIFHIFQIFPIFSLWPDGWNHPGSTSLLDECHQIMFKPEVLLDSFKKKNLFCILSTKGSVLRISKNIFKKVPQKSKNLFYFLKYQPIGKGGTRSPPKTPHRLQNPKWPPGGPKMADGAPINYR